MAHELVQSDWGPRPVGTTRPSLVEETMVPVAIKRAKPTLAECFWAADREGMSPAEAKKAADAVFKHVKGLTYPGEPELLWLRGKDEFFNGLPNKVLKEQLAALPLRQRRHIVNAVTNAEVAPDVLLHLSARLGLAQRREGYERVYQAGADNNQASQEVTEPVTYVARSCHRIRDAAIPNGVVRWHEWVVGYTERPAEVVVAITVNEREKGFRGLVRSVAGVAKAAAGVMG